MECLSCANLILSLLLCDSITLLVQDVYWSDHKEKINVRLLLPSFMPVYSTVVEEMTVFGYVGGCFNVLHSDSMVGAKQIHNYL